MYHEIQYSKNDLVRPAKRDNNSIRPYLLVDPLQGKHIPVLPDQAITLFHYLAAKLYYQYPGERLLILGFAETATAIGAAIACDSPVSTYYLQTTRETTPGIEYLYFSESHSHATEQKIAKNKLNDYLDCTDRIIFAEDEVTTGNTIRNLIKALQQEYGTKTLKFGIVSILNGMTKKTLDEFCHEGIECTYMECLEQCDYTSILSKYSYKEDLRYTVNCEQTSPSCNITFHTLSGLLDSRTGVSTEEYISKCRQMADEITNFFLSSLKGKKVLVLGAEEFMYPAMFAANVIQTNCNCIDVRFHATTRSPILPSSEPDYPLNSRWELRSLYDKDRITYIYNLEKYDKVLMIHDSKTPSAESINSLVNVFVHSGITDISFFQWI